MELLRVEHLDKTFGTNAALSDVSFSIDAGEVHALVGENGAGKSTLIKILAGIYPYDKGELIWQGRSIDIRSPQDARRLGISVVHQDRHLIPSFTGYENLYLGLDYPSAPGGIRIRWREMKQRAEALAREWNIRVPMNLPASQLSPPEQTLLEILRAAMLECRLLILDEPTASLTDQETGRLFQLIARLKANGTAILYVSHRLDEIFRIADRITVFRNGRHVTTAVTRETNKDQIIRWMSDARVRGRKLEHRRTSRTMLTVEGLTTADGRVRDVNLAVNRGEITGIFGLVGAGRTELLEAIYGLRPLRSGRLVLDGKPVAVRSPRQALDLGMVLIPEERQSDGLILSMSIRENMTLPVIDRFRRLLHIDARRERQAADQWMRSIKVKASDPDQPVRQLSGGNQQKVVFARALMSEPKIFLCDEPTQAVDVFTREEIHRLLRELADQGSGILFVTSDLQEMLDVADRLYILHEGSIAAELDNDGLTPEQVLKICFQQSKGESG